MPFKAAQHISISLIASLLLAGSAWADIHVSVKESLNDAQPVNVYHWFGDMRSVREDGSRYVITRLDENRTYIVDRNARSYKVLNTQLLPLEARPPVQVERTNQVRQINGWPTRLYRISGPAAQDMQIEVWASQEVGVDLDSFTDLMVQLSRRPGSEWLAAYASIRGFPILQEVLLERPGATLRSRSEVVSIEEREPPEGLYTPPEAFSALR